MYFVFFRHWIGFSDQFPFAQFDAIPDEGLRGALEELATRWALDHEEDLAQARTKRERERASRRLGMAEYTGMRSASRVPEQASDDGVTFESVRDYAGWSEGRMYAPPSHRVFVVEFDELEVATHVAAVLQARNPVEAIGRRFSVVAESHLGAQASAVARLQILDARRDCAVPVLGGRHPLFKVLRDVDNLWEQMVGTQGEEGHVVADQSSGGCTDGIEPASSTGEELENKKLRPGRPKADPVLDEAVINYLLQNTENWPPPAKIATAIGQPEDSVRQSLGRLRARKSLQKSRAEKGGQGP